MSWPTVKLGDVAKFINGGTPSKEITEYWSGYTAWISSADIVEDAIQKPRHYISDIAIQKSSTNIVPANTLLVVTRTGVGKLAITTEPLCFSQDITAVILREHCDINFVAKSIKSQTNSLVAQARGATIKGITRDVLESLLIPLPPLAQQKRIAAILGKADEIKRKREQAIAKLDQLAQSIFVEMFGNIANNDKGWDIKKWVEVLNIINGKNQKSVLTINGTYPIYGSGGNEMGRASDYLCNENTIIIGRKGNINKPILVKEKFWNVDTAFGLEAKKDVLSFHYLYWFCVFFDFERLNKTVTIPSLTKSDLLIIKIPLPPLALQEQFTTRISKLEKLKASNIAALEKHNQLFASLQNQVFTGQL